MSWRLLIVEDDAEISDSLAEVFAARGYRVEVASNGQQALDQIHATGARPDAILLDMLMPVLDGAGFLKARAAEPLLANVPVIVITAQSRPATSAPSVYARFEKPLTLPTLVDAVQRAVHGVPPASSASSQP